MQSAPSTAYDSPVHSLSKVLFQGFPIFPDVTDLQNMEVEITSGERKQRHRTHVLHVG